MASAVMTADAVELKVRGAVYKRQLRVKEFFTDFDTLRSGFVTSPQFRRCVLQNFGIALTEGELDALVSKYKRGGDVNYRSFADQIEKVFTEKNLERHPHKTLLPARTMIAGDGTMPYGDRTNALGSLLFRLKELLRYSGSDIRTAYMDFDKHNLGRVTMTQFQREFPVAPGAISANEMQQLIEVYMKGNEVDYMSLHRDVCQYGANDVFHAGAEALSAREGLVNTIDRGERQSVVDRIRVSFFRTRVRPIDFFKDHDRLRSAIITENQFIRGLTSACSAPKGLQLTANEIESVVSQYRAPGGVRYRDFCADVGGAFVVPIEGGGGANLQLEQHPTITPPEVIRSKVVHEVNAVGDRELQVSELVSRIRHEVMTRRIDCYAMFKDFDHRGDGSMKGISPSQFRRLLDQLRLGVSASQDFDLLVDKYIDHNGHVNYHAFLADIDPTTRLQKGDGLYFDPVAFAKTTYPRSGAGDAKPAAPPPVEAMKKLSVLLIKTRLRIHEAFEDIDQLRTGFVTPGRFRRALDNMFGTQMTPTELDAITAHYNTGAAPDSAAWKAFEADADAVFTVTELEKAPGVQVAPLTATYANLSVETSQLTRNAADTQLSNSVTEIISDIRAQMQQTRKSFVDNMRDNDRLRSGFITATQFQQGLSYGDIVLTDTSIGALLAYFRDDKGYLINYRSFVEQVTPALVQPHLGDTRRSQAEGDRAALIALEEARETDRAANVAWILEKVKSKVVKERRRVYDFFCDYDRLNSGRITEPMFERALDLARLGLMPEELKALADAYASKAAGYVEYLAFSEDVEEATTIAGLEQAPLRGTKQYVPLADIEIAAEKRTAGLQETSALNQVVLRFGDIARARRLELLPFFQDFDRINNGSVSRHQFARVLQDLGLACDDSELDALCQRYRVDVGGRMDVHYRSFCDDIRQTTFNLNAEITGGV